MHTRAPLVALLALASFSGCAPDGEGPVPFETVRRDSAGVELVLNSGTREQAPLFTELDSIPDVRLGSLDGRPEEQFGTVSDLVVLRDGGVGVLDGQAAQIRQFGPQGNYIRTVGGPGTGPGEFGDPVELGLLPGDTLAVFDARLNRVTRFHLDGTLGRTTTLEASQARAVVVRFLPDGVLVAQTRWVPPTPGSLPGPEPTFIRDTVVLLAFASEGVMQDTVDIVPGRETITSIRMGDGSIDIFRRPSAFGRSNVFATHSDGVWSAANDRFEMRLIDPASGQLIRIVRAPGLEIPISPEVATMVRDGALEEAETPEDRRRAESWYELSPSYENQPAFDLAEAGPNGRLWLREWTPGDAARRWWVFEGDGELLGSVTFPEGTLGIAVGCGVVWTVEQDDLDVSYVVRYGLGKSAADC